MNLINFIKAKGLHRTTTEIALDLVYAATGQHFPADKIALLLPQAVDVRKDIDTDANTYVPVVVEEVFDARYRSLPEDGFLYRRIPLSILNSTGVSGVVLPEVFPFTTHDILNDINAALNTQLSTNDVLNDEYTSPTDTIQVRAHPESLAWIGELIVARGGATEGRLLEDSSIRLTEDGSVRALEDESA